MTKNPNISSEKHRVKYQLQTIINSLAMLSKDSSGKITKLDASNKVMREIFGQKDIMQRLYKCRNGAQSMHVINYIGANTLFKMVSNRKLMSILIQLVDAKDRMGMIEKLVDKAERKGKRVPKDIIKEHAYLKKLYKDGTKMMRKHLGIKKMDSSNYKKRYSSLKDFVKDDYDGFFGGMAGFDFEDEDEDDDRDARFPGASFNPDLAEMIESSEDDDDEEDSIDDERFEKIEGNIDKITQILQRVLVSKKSSPLDEMGEPEPPVFHSTPVPIVPQNLGTGGESTFAILAQGMKNIENTMGQVNKSVGMVIDTVGKIDKRLTNVEAEYQNLMNTLLVDDDDDDDDEDIKSSSVTELGPRELVDDPPARLGVAYVPRGEMTSEELMEEINKQSTPEVKTLHLINENHVVTEQVSSIATGIPDGMLPRNNE